MLGIFCNIVGEWQNIVKVLNLQLFSVNGDVSIWAKNSRVGRSTKKQTNKKAGRKRYRAMQDISRDLSSQQGTSS